MSVGVGVGRARDEGRRPGGGPAEGDEAAVRSASPQVRRSAAPRRVRARVSVDRRAGEDGERELDPGVVRAADPQAVAGELELVRGRVVALAAGAGAGLGAAIDVVGEGRVVQGNLDPTVLLSNPATIEADIDDALHLVAEARVAEIAQIMNRLEGQGVTPVSLCITAARHFRALHSAASHPNGPDAGLSAVRPPVFGKRRDRMARQARALGLHKTETALSILMDADLDLRSSRPVPARATVERALIRIAMLART